MAEYALKARKLNPNPGAPLVPTGNPMIDGVGPAAYAMRADVPDLTVYGEDKIVPMSALSGWSVEKRDPDPRGMPVIGCDGKVAGTVVDLWVNRSEPSIAYYEVQLTGSEARRLLPYGYVQWPNFGLWGCDRLLVKSITAAQFAQVPTTKSATSVTRLEEDKIMAYYAGGHLYALPHRQEPWI